MHVPERLPGSPGPLSLLGAALAVALGILTLPAWAQTTLDDVALDSELTLVEENEFGSYRDYSITLAIRYGTATLAIDKDGERAELEVPLDECQALWRRVLDAGLESLTDSPVETFPDQSHFRIQYRIVDDQGAFEMHSVDELSDPRYRYVVRQILAMGDAYLALARREVQR